MDLSTTILKIVGHCGSEGPDDSSIAALNIFHCLVFQSAAFQLLCFCSTHNPLLRSRQHLKQGRHDYMMGLGVWDSLQWHYTLNPPTLQLATNQKPPQAPIKLMEKLLLSRLTQHNQCPVHAPQSPICSLWCFSLPVCGQQSQLKPQEWVEELCDDDGGGTIFSGMKCRVV